MVWLGVGCSTWLMRTPTESSLVQVSMQAVLESPKNSRRRLSTHERNIGVEGKKEPGWLVALEAEDGKAIEAG
jgi:hypothetical protein